MINKDLIILGAGPSGLFSAFYAGMRGMNVGIIDQLAIPGGQLATLYPEKYIYDIAGFPNIKAKDLVANLQEQLLLFDDTNDVYLNTQVTSIEKEADGSFVISTDNNELAFYASAVIIAGGNGGFSPRKLGLENEDDFQNIDYFIDDPLKYKDKKVIVFGGGDSAVDFALSLENIAKEVHLVHRRDEFRAHNHTVALLKKSTVNVLTPFVPKELIGSDGVVTSVIIENVKTKDFISLAVDEVICNFGFVSKIGPISNFGLELEKNKIPVSSAQETNIPGIFAVGDICTYPGKANLIAVGFGEAPIAVNQSYLYMDPNSSLGPMHSTSIMEERNNEKK